MEDISSSYLTRVEKKKAKARQREEKVRLTLNTRERKGGNKELQGVTSAEENWSSNFCSASFIHTHTREREREREREEISSNGID